MALKEIELNMSILVFAGSETTASALSGIIRMLLQNRPAMAVLKSEIRASFKVESDIEIASVGRLAYLNAVIEEGMRLCPPV
jgi:cytochrome P450